MRFNIEPPENRPSIEQTEAAAKKVKKWFDAHRSETKRCGLHYLGLHILYSPKTQKYYLTDRSFSTYRSLGYKDVEALVFDMRDYLGMP